MQPQPAGYSATSAAPPIRVCPSCGVIAPVQRTSCSICNAQFGPQPMFAPGRAGAALFACISLCDFQCRSCGLRSPIPAVEGGGEVECQRCGLSQAFNVSQWQEALEHAHAVADLSGPNPEGQNPSPYQSVAAKNSYVRLGVDHTASTKEQSTTIINGGGMQSLTLKTRVSPGHPLCRACKVPLNAGFDPSGALVTACARCGDRATYNLPANVRALAPGLRGVISDDLRADRPPARVDTAQAGVEAIACPQCGAALQLGAGEVATCAYCKTTARVPRRFLAKARGGEPPFTPFWLAFEGISPARAKLLSGTRDDDDDDDDDDAKPNAIQQQVAAQIANTNKTIQIIVAISVAVGLLIAVAAVGWSIYQANEAAPPPRPTPTRRH